MDVCGRCSTTLWHRDDYSMTAGFGTADVGCDYCQSSLQTDTNARISALEVDMVEVQITVQALPVAGVATGVVG